MINFMHQTGIYQPLQGILVLTGSCTFLDPVSYTHLGGKVNDELAGKEGSTKVTVGSNTTKKAEDLAEAYSVELKDVKNHEYILVNTSGKVIDNKGKNKDGSDYYYEMCIRDSCSSPSASSGRYL